MSIFSGIKWSGIFRQLALQQYLFTYVHPVAFMNKHVNLPYKAAIWFGKGDHLMNAWTNVFLFFRFLKLIKFMVWIRKKPLSILECEFFIKCWKNLRVKIFELISQAEIFFLDPFQNAKKTIHFQLNVFCSMEYSEDTQIFFIKC